MATQHDPARWQQLPLVQQLANIGSEVSRFVSWQIREDRARQEQAAGRALELLDFTIADSRWRHRLRELTRLREVCQDVFRGGGAYDVTVSALQAYFFPFAIAARRKII